jgi:hypothetical protein
MQDPLGLSADGDVEKFNRYRAIEIKHGRGECLRACSPGRPDPTPPKFHIRWSVCVCGGYGGDGCRVC